MLRLQKRRFGEYQKVLTGIPKTTSGKRLKETLNELEKQ